MKRAGGGAEREEVRRAAIRPAVLTAKEAAVYLSISIVTLYRLIRSGELPHTRVGGGIRFRVVDLEEYLEVNTTRTWRSNSGKGGRGVQEKKQRR